jgi:acetyltransferase
MEELELQNAFLDQIERRCNEVEMRQHTVTQSSPSRAGSPSVRVVELKDRTSVILRPLRRDDEAIVSDFFASCTPRTLRQRFHYSFKLTPEWVARRCHIDESREVAIVAETETLGAHKVAGFSRLVFSPDHESAEFAIIITDDWQGKGLGCLMTRHCLEVVRTRGIKRVTAVTTPDNLWMIAVFKKLSFSLNYDWPNGVIWVSKELSPPASVPKDSKQRKDHLKRTA